MNIMPEDSNYSTDEDINNELLAELNTNSLEPLDNDGDGGYGGHGVPTLPVTNFSQK